MEETFTKPLNVAVKKNAMNETEAVELLEADDIVFYHSLRPDLDTLLRKPLSATVQNVLGFSQTWR